MLFSFRSMAWSSAWIAASSSPFVLDFDDPTVPGTPDEFAVPALLVPGGGGGATVVELPLPELLTPPALAGLEDTPPAAPPVLCANALTGNIMTAIATTADVTDALAIGNSLDESTATAAVCSNGYRLAQADCLMGVYAA